MSQVDILLKCVKKTPNTFYYQYTKDTKDGEIKYTLVHSRGDDVLSVHDSQGNELKRFTNVTIVRHQPRGEHRLYSISSNGKSLSVQSLFPQKQKQQQQYGASASTSDAGGAKQTGSIPRRVKTTISGTQSPKSSHESKIVDIIRGTTRKGLGGGAAGGAGGHGSIRDPPSHQILNDLIKASQKQIIDEATYLKVFRMITRIDINKQVIPSDTLDTLLKNLGQNQHPDEHKFKQSFIKLLKDLHKKRTTEI